jgi:hypothetical protein
MQLAEHWRRVQVLESEFDGPPLSNVGNQCGPEARKTRAACAPNARVHDSADPATTILWRHLRAEVAVRVQTPDVRAVAPDVVKVGSKVGQVIIERKGFRFTPIDFSELQSLMESHLGHGGIRFKRRVPRASLGTIKAMPRGCACVNAAFTIRA